MARVKVTARKWRGDDPYSWAVFRSDQSRPVISGLSKREVPYYKVRVKEILDRESTQITVGMNHPGAVLNDEQREQIRRFPL